MHNDFSIFHFSKQTALDQQLLKMLVHTKVFLLDTNMHHIDSLTSIYFKRNIERMYKDAEVYGHKVQTDL